jgi:hypothetical protein
MTMSQKRLLCTLGLCVLLVTAVPAESQSPQAPASEVTGRSIKAIGYNVGGGGTTVDLKSSGLIPAATGEAKVEAKGSVTTIEVKVRELALPTPLGTEFLSYVVWAVSPEGRAVNLGEVRPDKNGGGALKVTTQLQSFSLFVTAEPYPFVRQPSEMLVLENDVRKNTKGRLFIVEDYKLMKRNQYQVRENPLALSLGETSTDAGQLTAIIAGGTMSTGAITSCSTNTSTATAAQGSGPAIRPAGPVSLPFSFRDSPRSTPSRSWKRG